MEDGKMKPQAVIEWTIDSVCQSVGDDVLAEIEALGNQINKAQWRIGQIAGEWIKAGMPAMLVYSVIAKRAGKRPTSIRNYFYTYRDTPLELRETYEAPFAIFNHARQVENPTDVLEYWHSENATITEVEKQFPISAPDEIIEKRTFEFPIWASPLFRRLSGLQPEKKSRAEILIKELIVLLGD